ncbi:T6SS effector amidase Tae4 family protein [Yersinia rohdei]|uniref:T6SS effector amidase Tae4 family protein n=1 Tax=Yersinia rohdei TaxID=29485 RepID=UPI0011A51D61|nr:T6SS effector amidase Tae4 family protein [Yersinia rohdei]
MTTITARAGNTVSTLNIKRPAWSHVYAGYPKTSGGPASEDDLSAETIFTEVFGSTYDRAIYSNACGTRVSLALLAGGMQRVGGREIGITVKTHAFYGKYIEPGAAKLKEFLEIKWKKPEYIIKQPKILDDVSIKLNGKKGIYIMIPKIPKKFGASGHATLWTGNRVIGDHHYISDNTFAVYLWELK